MESIHTKVRMKGQGSHELVNEAKKERIQERLTIDNFFYESGLHVRYLNFHDLGLDRKVFC